MHPIFSYLRKTAKIHPKLHWRYTDNMGLGEDLFLFCDNMLRLHITIEKGNICLLYTSDAADE